MPTSPSVSISTAQPRSRASTKPLYGRWRSHTATDPSCPATLSVNHPLVAIPKSLKLLQDSFAEAYR